MVEQGSASNAGHSCSKAYRRQYRWVLVGGLHLPDQSLAEPADVCAFARLAQLATDRAQNQNLDYRTYAGTFIECFAVPCSSAKSSLGKSQELLLD